MNKIGKLITGFILLKTGKLIIGFILLVVLLSIGLLMAWGLTNGTKSPEDGLETSDVLDSEEESSSENDSDSDSDPEPDSDSDPEPDSNPDPDPYPDPEPPTPPDEGDGLPTYEEYVAMTPAEKAEFFNSFATPDEFFLWHDEAKMKYEEEHPDEEIGGDGNIDIGG